MWLESMDAEFEGRLLRMIRGPMWSGLDKKDEGNPLKVCISTGICIITMNVSKKRDAGSNQYSNKVFYVNASCDICSDIFQ